jgi:hypothetical protein
MFKLGKLFLQLVELLLVRGIITLNQTHEHGHEKISFRCR